jgi:AraC family transcriptional regulator
LPASNCSRGTRHFKLVVDFIEEPLTGDLGLFELASLAGLGVADFSHAFKAASGISPHGYIVRRRMERAKRLLRTTGETVPAIAARVGFSDVRRFRRTFARLTGSMPSACRA